MKIYELIFSVNGNKFNTLFTDSNQALDEVSKHARDYDETIVYEYVEKDGRFYVTKTLIHIGGCED